MSYAPAAVLVFVAVVVALPLATAGLGILLAGRPTWLSARRSRRAEPDIHAYLMLVVLVIVALALFFVVPFAVAFGGLPHAFTAVAGAFLIALVMVGVGYAWRRGVLRWQ